MMSQRTFVYVSAEDVFRPFVPQRYIETKRQAERELALRSMEDAETSIRTVFIRPGMN